MSDFSGKQGIAESCDKHARTYRRGGVKVIYRPRLFEVEQFYLDPVTWSTVEQALA